MGEEVCSSLIHSPHREHLQGEWQRRVGYSLHDAVRSIKLHVASRSLAIPCAIVCAIENTCIRNQRRKIFVI